jgi:hypothetical protein
MKPKFIKVTKPIKQALLESIEKWEKCHKLLLKFKDIYKQKGSSIVYVDDSELFYHGGNNCPLCDIVYSICEKCPISIFSNHCNCINTPYRKYLSINTALNTRRQILGAHQAEINFLKDLYKICRVKKGSK